MKPSLQNKNDIMNLASALAGNFMGIVQYNLDNRAFEVSIKIYHCVQIVESSNTRNSQEITS